MNYWAIGFLILCCAALAFAAAAALRGLRDPDLSKLGDLNPDRVTIEVVAGIFRTSRWSARQLCEMAVRRGEFERNGDDYKLASKET